MVPSLGAGAGPWCPAGSRLRRPGERVVRAEGVEPSRAEAQRIFIPSTAFAARTRRFEAHASGLRSGLSLHRLLEGQGLRCCPSSLYTFPAGMFGPGLARDCHYRFPRIWAVLHPRFPDEHSSFLKSVASACSATPAWAGCAYLFIIGQRYAHLRFLLSFRLVFSSFLFLVS